MTNQYLLIAGCTGVGKTAVADFLHKHYVGSRYFTDPYVDNPFISQAYSKINNKCFQSEIFFIKEFFKIHKIINGISEQWILQERSIFECVNIFCRLFLHQSKIDQLEYDLCRDLLNELSCNIRKPDMIIHLKADSETILKRIMTRNRSFENNINLEFIETQRFLYEGWLTQFSQDFRMPIIEIDNSEMDICETNQAVLLEIQNLYNSMKNN